MPFSHKHTIHKPKFTMQSNKKLDLNPAIQNVEDLLSKVKVIRRKEIKSYLRELEIFLKGTQAESEGKVFFEDENGEYVTG